MLRLTTFAAIILLSLTAASAQEQARTRHHAAEKRLVLKHVARVGKARADVKSPAGTRVLRTGRPTTYLKNGLKLGEVVKFLGRPVALSERQEGAQTITSYTFQRGGRRVLVAEFVNGTLVGSRVEEREYLSDRGL